MRLMFETKYIITAVDEAVKEHMEEQPFDIHCDDCGKTLECGTVKVDEEMDLLISVSPCEYCMSNAKTNAHKEGYEEGIEEAKADPDKY